MFDLASIRNASFTLTPTGYNPEEVDQFLADLADQLAAEVAAAPVVEPAVEPLEVDQPAADPPSRPPTIDDLSQPVERPEADLEGLAVCIERTISSLDSFVNTELAAVRTASDLEIDEIHRERERLLEEAAEAARAHLDDARVRADRIVLEARGDGDELRRRFEQELAVERDRFEQALSEREAQARAQVDRVLAEAEDRRREADEVVSHANRVQLQVLDSLDQARVSLGASSLTISDPADQGAGSDGESAGERSSEAWAAAPDQPEIVAEPADSGQAEPEPADPEAWPRQVRWPQQVWDGDDDGSADGGGRYPNGSADATDAAA